MRLLANENIPIATVVALRDAGYDVTSLFETTPGIADEKALALAREQGRILVTFDRDYGNRCMVVDYLVHRALFTCA